MSLEMPTVAEVKRALGRKDYFDVRRKCDLALSHHKGKDLTPFLLAGSTAVRLTDELKLAPQDAEEAISVGPTNPEANISLGQALHSLAIKAMADGRPKCRTNEHAFTLGRLISMESNASRALTCVENTGRDPYFLPKEVFHRLLLPLEASTKARCIRINKAWKPELKGDTTIWRESNTLTSVVLYSNDLDSRELSSIFHSLHQSVSSLRSLTFGGHLYQIAATPEAFKFGGRMCSSQLF